MDKPRLAGFIPQRVFPVHHRLLVFPHEPNGSTGVRINQSINQSKKGVGIK
jgi:hypothetical protein